ncbi:hypothetical protein CEE37_03510 [candidate division LCP-89 bacterium B3_LCP]|uniref:DUF362 domain-containing protein n=1 Tax=candidate division LCP-89 bacterium B3_LCP TaxID=2012998 RepID=A0A532V3S6_UNCL8|nr:MAG: hypothetical protein CEE37_03510 [candidate division LCP-89 bacterium B3_LCP]
MKRSRVHIAHKEVIPGTPNDYDESSLNLIQDMVSEAVDGLDFSQMVKGRSVLIKPNLVRPDPHVPSAVTTDPRVIIAMMRHCLDSGAKTIGIGDKPGIGLSCRGGEELLGLGKYYGEVGAHFVYFDESEEVWEENPPGRLCESIPIPQVLREYEVLINLPKLKLHMHTGVSLGIKNLFGLIPEHFRMKHHREDLHRFLVDYLYLVKPDMTIIDGIWALEGQAPICGTPVQDFNAIIASADIVAADSIGAYLMGVEPDEIAMIRMAAQEGFGHADLDQIEVTGVKPDEIRRHFKRPVLSSQNAYPGIDVIVKGGCVGCYSSLRHALDRLHAAGHLQEDPQTIIVGMRHKAKEQNLSDHPGVLWCYGNCCVEQFIEYHEGDENSHWLEGCPPHFMNFYRAYLEAMGIDVPEQK